MCVVHQKRMADSQKKIDKTDPKKDEKEKTKANECPICLDQISNLCRTDPCAHEFCLQCLRNWAREHNCCPVCRQVFDRILHNFRADNQFDTIPVDNRESRVRRSLFQQRDALRQNLTQLRTRVDREIEDMRRRLEEREATRNRITDSISRIDAINRQNNGQMDSTLNEIRNIINEMNHERHSANGPLSAIMSWTPTVRNALPQPLVPSLMQNSDFTEIIPLASTDTDSTESVAGSQTSSDSNESVPQVVEWNIYGPNSRGRITVSSTDDPNGHVFTQRSVVISGSPSQQMDSDDQSGSLFGPLGQLFGENVNTQFSDMENRMNRIFGGMMQNFNLGFSGSPGGRTSQPNRAIQWRHASHRPEPNGRQSTASARRSATNQNGRGNMIRRNNRSRQRNRYHRHQSNRGRNRRN